MSLREILSKIALLALLLAMLVGGAAVLDATKCRPRYELETPDGQVFNLGFGPGYAGGSGQTVELLDSQGLPGLQHQMQQLYHVPGVVIQDVEVQHKIITLTLSVWSTDGTRSGLRRNLGQIYDVFRWDRGPGRTDLSTLRVTIGDDVWETGVKFQDAIESQQGRVGRNAIVAIRLEQPDPRWWDGDESSLVLDWEDSATFRRVAARLGGLWDSLGPPAVPGGAGLVRAMAYDEDTGDVYIGGDFTNWDGLGVGPGDYIVKWDYATQTWQTVGAGGGGPGLPNVVHALTWTTDGYLLIGGQFTVGGGAPGDYVAVYDKNTDVITALAAGGTGTVYDIVELQDGTIVLAGSFVNWNAIGFADRVVSYTDAGGYAAMDQGFADGWVEALAVLRNGNVVAGGSIQTTGAGVTVRQVSEWDGTAWGDMDGGFAGGLLTNALAVGPDGKLYATGSWTATITGTQVNYVAVWNGASWRDMDGGLDLAANSIAVDPVSGTVYVAGIFGQAGDRVVDYLARWNGNSWARVDFEFPAGVPSLVKNWVFDGVLHIAFDLDGIAYHAGDNTPTDAGSAPVYPTIEIKNQGHVWTIRNETTGEEMLFDMQVLDGEIVEITTQPGEKAVTSNRRPLGRLGDLLPPGMGDWKLESGPRAAYGGTDGANLVTVFITDADPRETGDNNNQLSDWGDITGIAQSNTDLGWIYVNIVADGGGFYHVDLYMDSGKAAADLVGHTGSYNGAGAEPIIEDNASGLGGSITVDAVVAADTDIEVVFTIVTATWRDAWWSLSEAIRDAVA
jgi:hypothetical protein